jgi:hypothetical protein
VASPSHPRLSRACGLLLALALPLVAGCPGSLAFQYQPPDADLGNGGAGDPTGTGGDGDPGGAGGMGGGGDGIQTSCPNAASLIQTSCGSCHASPPVAVAYTSLDLLGAGVAARLVGHPADTANASSDQCAGRGNILNIGTLPATGILIDKINGAQTCGVSMPFAAVTPLSASDIACIQAWANGLVQSVGTN